MALNITLAATMANAIEALIDDATGEDLSTLRDLFRKYMTACDLRHKDLRSDHDWDTPKGSCFTEARTAMGI